MEDLGKSLSYSSECICVCWPKQAAEFGRHNDEQGAEGEEEEEEAENDKDEDQEIVNSIDSLEDRNNWTLAATTGPIRSIGIRNSNVSRLLARAGRVQESENTEEAAPCAKP